MEPLLTRLLQWFVRLVNQGEGSLVIKKLCTSLIAYFFRPSVSWDKCLLHVLLCFKEGDAVNQDRLKDLSALDATSIMPQLQRPQLLATLWFATNLIEEVGKTDAASLQAFAYQKPLVDEIKY